MDFLQNTTNYNLKKPDGTDNYNIEHQNDNMDIIDAEMKANSDKIDNLAGTGRTIETVKGNADALVSHEADAMPHQFVDGATTYRYGFKPNATNDGLVFVYEEVI